LPGATALVVSSLWVVAAGEECDLRRTGPAR
jgi:hypothetical protein